VTPWPRWKGTIAWAFLLEINDHRLAATTILKTIPFISKSPSGDSPLGALLAPTNYQFVGLFISKNTKVVGLFMNDLEVIQSKGHLHICKVLEVFGHANQSTNPY
jgi:hypothetical protein